MRNRWKSENCGNALSQSTYYLYLFIARVGKKMMMIELSDLRAKEHYTSGWEDFMGNYGFIVMISGWGKLDGTSW